MSAALFGLLGIECACIYLQYIYYIVKRSQAAAAMMMTRADGLIRRRGADTLPPTEKVQS